MRKMLGLFFVLGILMLPSVARAEATSAERWACQQDAFRVCGAIAIPRRDRCAAVCIRICVVSVHSAGARCRRAGGRAPRSSSRPGVSLGPEAGTAIAHAGNGARQLR
jgi:hypothetical protein